MRRQYFGKEEVGTGSRDDELVVQPDESEARFYGPISLANWRGVDADACGSAERLFDMSGYGSEPAADDRVIVEAEGLHGYMRRCAIAPAWGEVGERT